MDAVAPSRLRGAHPWYFSSMSEGEPFRDGMSAALMRIDQLAGENEQLRDELLRLRKTAGDVKTQSTDHHANTLADQTLALLDRLDTTMSERRPATEVEATFPTTKELEVRADASVLVSEPKRQLEPPVIPLAPPNANPSRARWVAACVACFLAGMLAGRASA